MVRITDKSVMPKRINGQIELIKILQAQKNEAEDSGVKMWYDKIIAHSVITLLRLVAQNDDSRVDSIVRMLKSMNVFPLRKFRVSLKNKIRLDIINVCPAIFCYMSKHR